MSRVIVNEDKDEDEMDDFLETNWTKNEGKMSDNERLIPIEELKGSDLGNVVFVLADGGKVVFSSIESDGTFALNGQWSWNGVHKTQRPDYEIKHFYRIIFWRG